MLGRCRGAVRIGETIIGVGIVDPTIGVSGVASGYLLSVVIVYLWLGSLDIIYETVVVL